MHVKAKRSRKSRTSDTLPTWPWISVIWTRPARAVRFLFLFKLEFAIVTPDGNRVPVGPESAVMVNYRLARDHHGIVRVVGSPFDP